MTIVHLTASRFFGAPERQMIELAAALRPGFDSAFIAFWEDGLFEPFLAAVRGRGFRGIVLRHDTPRLLAASRELTATLRAWNADLLVCHSVKPNLLGLLAARRLGIPVISVSHGWTGENFRVRLYDVLDRRLLRWMDRVVAVSGAQAQKLRRAGVTAGRCHVIRNAVRSERFQNLPPDYRDRLCRLFPQRPRWIVGAAGRLSPEKGFAVLVEAAAGVLRADPAVGFVLFGAGRLREALARQIADLGLGERFILAGFRSDLDQFLPHLDLLVQASFTEGLPNIVLEACAAGVPVVATAVGGTPEIIDDGVHGFLVPPGDPAALAQGIFRMFADDARRREMATRGCRRVRETFSFESQAQSYAGLIHAVAGSSPAECCSSEAD